MGLFGKFAKAIIANAAENAADSKKSSNTASSAEIEKIKNRPLPKQIQKDLEQLRKDKDALSKKFDKLGFDL